MCGRQRAGQILDGITREDKGVCVSHTPREV